MITMTLASARSVRGLATVPKLAPTVTLASGHEMPVMALGTWKAPGGATGAAVEAASRNNIKREAVVKREAVAEREVEREAVAEEDIDEYL